MHLSKFAPPLALIGHANPSSSNYPKSVTALDGKQIRLGHYETCIQKYGFAPHTILKSSEKQFTIMGISQEDGSLWVKDESKKGRAYQLKDVTNQEELNKLGYTAVEETLKRKREAQIEDSDQVLACAKRVLKKQSMCDIFFEIGPEKKKRGGHTFFLKAHSKDFKKDSLIKVPDCTGENFDLFLDYLYSGSITLNLKNILPFASIAEDLHVTKLKERCSTVLPTLLFPYHAAEIYFQSNKKPGFLAAALEKYFFDNLSLICEEYPYTLSDLSEENLLLILKKLHSQDPTALMKVTMIWLTQMGDKEKKLSCFNEKIWPIFPQDTQSLFNCATFLGHLISLSAQKEQFESYYNLSVSKSMAIPVIYIIALSLIHQTEEAQKKWEEISNSCDERILSFTHFDKQKWNQINQELYAMCDFCFLKQRREK